MHVATLFFFYCARSEQYRTSCCVGVCAPIVFRRLFFTSEGGIERKRYDCAFTGNLEPNEKANNKRLISRRFSFVFLANDTNFQWARHKKQRQNNDKSSKHNHASSARKTNGKISKLLFPLLIWFCNKLLITQSHVPLACDFSTRWCFVYFWFIFKSTMDARKKRENIFRWHFMSKNLKNLRK